MVDVEIIHILVCHTELVYMPIFPITTLEQADFHLMFSLSDSNLTSFNH